MDESIRRFRSQVSRFKQDRSRTGVRYSPGFRAEVVVVARRRVGQGVGLRRTAREIGVAPWTLARWVRPGGPPVLRAVTVVPDPEATATSPQPVLVAPSGFRVEGLDAATLVTMLRALSAGRRFLCLHESYAPAGQGPPVGRHGAVHLCQAPGAGPLRVFVA